MATTFDELLIPTTYSALADGGPEFASAIVRSGNGGAVAKRNSNREDYVSRYEIEYGELPSDDRAFLRTFAILRDGMTRGFRFLAPDDHELTGTDGNGELVGWLNPATGEVERLAQTDGVLNEFFFIKYYSDQCNNYTRRIIKPSPFDNLTINLCDPVTGDVLASGGIAANAGVGAYNVINPTVDGTIFLVGSFGFTVYQNTGKLVFESPLSAGYAVKVACVYHLPAAFAADWHKFSVDEVGISSFKVPLEEILPAELGIV
jgi:uncharacterized protein (TIGR02217 family)